MSCDDTCDGQDGSYKYDSSFLPALNLEYTGPKYAARGPTREYKILPQVDIPPLEMNCVRASQNRILGT